MKFVGEGIGEGDQCRDAKVLRCSLCRGEISLSPLLPSSLAAVGKGAVEQGGEVGVLGDVGQALNVNTYLLLAIFHNVLRPSRRMSSQR